RVAELRHADEHEALTAELAVREQSQWRFDRHQVGDLAQRVDAAIRAQHRRAAMAAYAHERVVVAELDVRAAIRARGLQRATRDIAANVPELALLGHAVEGGACSFRAR